MNINLAQVSPQNCAGPPTPRGRTDDWIEVVDTCRSVEEGMSYVLANEKELFYLFGDSIKKMIQYRLDLLNT